MEWKHVGRRKRSRKTVRNSLTTNQPSSSSSSKTQHPSHNNNYNKKEEEEELMMSSSKTPPSTSSSSSSSDVFVVAPTPDLPCSILIDILGRLPLKTLIDCRYVCKTWRSLLTESYFYRLYSHHTPTALILQVKGNSLDCLRRICVIEEVPARPDGDGPSREVGFMTRKMILGSGSGRPAVDPLNFRFQLGNGCNGLVCLREIRTREPTVVWNPIMGQFVMIPKPATTADDKVVAGFGYCGRTSHYKVLRIFHKEKDPPNRRRAEVYDLGVGNEWRGIGDVPFDIPSRIPGFFTNNSLHWILDNDSNGNGSGSKQIEDGNNNNIDNNSIDDDNKSSLNLELICGFDFVEETFKAITPPPIFSDQENKYHWSNLGIIIDCLSICAIDAKVFRPDVQVWVMEDYGVPESWALRLSIRDPTVDWWDPYRWIQVTNFLRNGEIIMLCAHCYILAYNLRERRFRSIEGLDSPAIAHVPSLISLEDVLSETNGTGSLNVRYL